MLEQTEVQLLQQSVTLEFNQCNYYYELQQDAVFSDSVQTPLTLFIDLQNIAWGRNGVEPIESGCFQGVSGSDGVVRSVCLSVPHMIPMSVSEQPTIERFHIYKADSTVDTAGGVLVFLWTIIVKCWVGFQGGFIIKPLNYLIYLGLT